MTIHRRYLLAVLLMVATGCAGVLETPTYPSETKTFRYPASYDKVWQSALAGLNRLGFAVQPKKSPRHHQKISAKSPKGAKAELAFKTIDADSTSVTVTAEILVGEERILEEIDNAIQREVKLRLIK